MLFNFRIKNYFKKRKNLCLCCKLERNEFKLILYYFVGNFNLYKILHIHGSFNLRSKIFKTYFFKTVVANYKNDTTIFKS